MAYIVIELPDFDLLGKHIGERIQRLRTLDEPLANIRADFYAMEDAWLTSEGQGQWQPLSPRYAAWKNQHFPGKTILRRSDAMYNMAAGHPGSSTLRLGELHINMENVPYWEVHQKGLGRIPQRQVISPEIETRKMTWHTWITEWLRSKTTGQP